MRLTNRIRERRDDPYRGFYGSRPSLAARVAVTLPVLVALAFAGNFAYAAVTPSAHEPAALRPAAGISYRSLLIPSAAGSAAAAPTLQGARSNQAHATFGSAAVAAPRSASAASKPHTAFRTDENGYRLASRAILSMVPYTTVKAHLMHTTKGYASEDALQSNRKVPGSWYGYPSILPVVDSTRDRLKVMLAQRPNESTSWIKRSKAVLSRTHYAIVIDLSQHWLYVFKRGVQQFSFPVGHGAPGTPTPTGNFFVAFHAPPTNSGYAPVMLETSGHSRVIARFDGGDDAIIAIHGPVGSDAQIGTRGAAISNGCIRMHKSDLQKVRQVRNGAPVIITY